VKSLVKSLAMRSQWLCLALFDGVLCINRSGRNCPKSQAFEFQGGSRSSQGFDIM